MSLEYVLDPELIDDGIDEIEFGKDGKHFFVAGPYDDDARIKDAAKSKWERGIMTIELYC